MTTLRVPWEHGGTGGRYLGATPSWSNGWGSGAATQKGKRQACSASRAHAAWPQQMCRRARTQAGKGSVGKTPRLPSGLGHPRAPAGRIRQLRMPSTEVSAAPGGETQAGGLGGSLQYAGLSTGQLTRPLDHSLTTGRPMPCGNHTSWPHHPAQGPRRWN